jgi:hypothetical protein
VAGEFLLVPFLRFLRALQVLRLVHVARLAHYRAILPAGIRPSRSAGRLLSSRLGWLTAVNRTGCCWAPRGPPPAGVSKNILNQLEYTPT